MKTPISYYGGKANMLNVILPLIPPHTQYVEPFFGGGSVFFAKRKSDREVINDINNNVVNFYKVMQLKFDELNNLISTSLQSEYQHKLAGKLLKDETATDVQRAWAFFIQTNLSFGGKIGAGFSHTNKKYSAAVKVRKRTFKQLENRLDGIEIFCRDAINVIKLKDRPSTFFYIDPPYVSADQGHYKGYTAKNFAELLETLANIKGKFLLSSYMEPQFDDYKNAGWHQQAISYHHGFNNTANATQHRKKIEILTYNYEPAQAQLKFAI